MVKGSAADNAASLPRRGKGTRYFPKNERQRDFDENRGKKICRKICRIDVAGQIADRIMKANNEDKFKICSMLYLDGGISGSDDFITYCRYTLKNFSFANSLRNSFILFD